MTDCYDLDFNDFKKKLYLNIKYQRKLGNLTQEQLADRLAITTQYISELENTKIDNSPSLKLLYLIAKVLNIDLKDLIPSQ